MVSNQLNKAPFDIVLTDLQMSGMDRIALASYIKEKSPDTPIILMTGSRKKIVIEKERESCVDFVIFKPFYFNDIKKKIDSLFNKGGISYENSSEFKR